MTKRLKILHWPTSYPDPEYGLPYSMIFVEEHIRAASLFHDQAVLFLSPSTPKNGALTHISQTIEHGVPVTRIRHKGLRPDLFNRSLAYWLTFREIARLVTHGFRPDIIHAHIFASARLPALIARLWHIPFVVTEHWTALCREGALSNQRLKLAKQIYERADMVLPVSISLQRCIEKNTGAKFKGCVIYNTVNPKIFFYKADQNNSSDCKRILVVERLEQPKDIPTLLRAAALLYSRFRNIQLDIIGKGNPAPYIELSRQLGIGERVAFYGEQTKPVIAGRMRAADVLAHSSLLENSPCVIGEALCCGLPAVATNVGGVPELIPAEAGRRVPPADPIALANALEEVLNNQNLFDRPKIAARAKERFSYEAIGTQLDQVYRSVIRS